MNRETVVQEGIERAFGDWLHQKTAITLPDIFDAALTRTFQKWLDDNKTEIMAIVANQIQDEA